MLEALEKTLWNQSKAAELIGMPRRTFVKRLAQYDLPRPRKRDT
jgi:DNA-binding protein Fis